MKTNTFTCDQCGRSEVTEEFPHGWRQVVFHSVDADNVGDYNGDLCSPECAANWSKKRFEEDLKL